MTKPIFALVDCNNFFVSCVRVFRPDLNNKPVVALSSNDGCVVARSNEAKALGIPMGAPAFKWRQFFKDHSVEQFSGNFELYGDMSKRIASLLSAITPRIEIYSVDESFLDISQLPLNNLEQWGKEVRESILKWTGIPVSIGVAPSKALAKLASDRAKKESSLAGVLDLNSLSEQARGEYLERTPIEDVWGVGRKFAPKLRSMGISDAHQLAVMAPRLAQQTMGIQGRQLVTELSGTACFKLEQFGRIQKSISVTRTFGEDTSKLHVLESAIASFCAKATYRLRRSKQLTFNAGLFVATNRHKPGYSMRSAQVKFTMPTSDTGIVTSALVKKLSELFNPNASYHRAGVFLSNFVPETSMQTDLFGDIDVTAHQRSVDSMQAIDELNDKYGKRTVHYASEDLANSWQPIHAIDMPSFTTRWEELPTAKIRK